MIRNLLVAGFISLLALAPVAAGAQQRVPAPGQAPPMPMQQQGDVFGMSAKQAMVVGVSAIVGAVVVHAVVGGAAGTLIGAAAGALVGNWWHQQDQAQGPQAMNRPTNYIDRSSTLMKEAAQEISGLAAQASEYVDDASANIRTRLAGLTDAF